MSSTLLEFEGIDGKVTKNSLWDNGLKNGMFSPKLLYPIIFLSCRSWCAEEMVNYRQSVVPILMIHQ